MSLAGRLSRLSYLTGAFAALAVTIVAFNAVLVSACPFCEKGREKYLATKAVLVEGLGRHHHQVTTKSQEAQCFFDQGLTYCFAFNHDEAIRSFKRAAELDPEMAMAHWGYAYALGTNYNLPIDSAREVEAYGEVQKALSLMKKCGDNERDYIRALATRYTADGWTKLGQLDTAYKNAMGEVHRKNPDDLDAATLYAESAMDLRPWMLWDRNGIPAPGTEEIVSTLESVLKRDPDHIGANHFYIHAVEASSTPERALASAYRIGKLVPGAGHLVHMPAHAFIRTGDYAAAVAANRAAVKLDSEYVAAGGAGIYTVIYYPHNMHFLAVSLAMCGERDESIKYAELLEQTVAPYVGLAPMVEGVMPTKYLLLVKFRQWDKILALPKPDKELEVMNMMWHYARGMAYAAIGKSGKAQSELGEFNDAEKKLPPTAMIGTLNLAPAVTPIAKNSLIAKIAESKKKIPDAIKYMRMAVAAQDTVSYDEPEAWYLSPRESLGGLLLRNGQYEEAEKVFREDLVKYPRNGRSLFGLEAVLKARENVDAAQFVEQQFQAAWKDADTKLRIEDL